LSQNIESVASIRARVDQGLDRHQRMMEDVTGALGRPRTVYMILAVVLGWIALNTILRVEGRPPIDPPPFFWLQGVVALSALLMTTLVLITENRQARVAEQRSHLDLQVNVLAEHKIAKLIALVEELRRDLPMVKNRVDREADSMQEAADPDAILVALGKIADPAAETNKAAPDRTPHKPPQ
jgi:uncharacterized membrane protein